MKHHHALSRWAAISTVLAAATLAGLACGADQEKARREAREECRAEFEKRVQAEVARRVGAELPKMERRLRAELAGGKRAVNAANPGDPRPSLPTDRADVPPRDVAADPGGDAGVRALPVTGPPALPPDTKEAKAPDVDPQGLVVKRVLLARNLVERKPEGEGTAFTLADKRIYCYIDAQNPKGPERKLTVVWHHGGKVFHRLALRVGVGHVWRTWAFLSVRPGHDGNWRCGVFNEEGQLIRGVDFTIARVQAP